MDKLGDRMKQYEAATRSVLMPQGIYIIRVDGRAFHQYLRKAAKPYDFEVMADMQEVAKGLCSEVSGTVFAYGQSDEISLIVQNRMQSQPWFGGVTQKVASIAASCATAHLIARRGTVGLPQFDARVFQVPSWQEAANYTIWRQRDAVRNSITMAAQAHFSHKQLHGKRSNEKQEMLFQQHGINWNDYPEAAKRGWVLTREASEREVTYRDKRTGETRAAKAVRSDWVLSTPHLTIGSELFKRLLPPDPDSATFAGSLS